MAEGWERSLKLMKMSRVAGPLLILTMASAGLGGCAPAYDDVADQIQVDAEKKIDAGLIRLESDQRAIAMLASLQGADADKQRKAVTADAGFAGNIAFYADVESDLDTLRSRLGATGERSGTLAANGVAKIAANVELMREQHAKAGTLSIAFTQLMKRAFDEQFKLLDLYQLQVKSGSKA